MSPDPFYDKVAYTGTTFKRLTDEERATTQPSLFESTAMGVWAMSGQKRRRGAVGRGPCA